METSKTPLGQLSKQAELFLSCSANNYNTCLKRSLIYKQMESHIQLKPSFSLKLQLWPLLSFLDNLSAFWSQTYFFFNHFASMIYAVAKCHNQLLPNIPCKNDYTIINDSTLTIYVRVRFKVGQIFMNGTTSVPKSVRQQTSNSIEWMFLRPIITVCFSMKY